MHGTTKDFAFTIFAADKSHAAVVPATMSTCCPGRVQGAVAAVTRSTISLSESGSTAKTTYTLDPAVADPNTAVNYHGRTIHATTIPIGSIVELKLNDKTPAAVTAMNVADQEIDAGISGMDTVNNKITLDDSGSTVINVDPKNTVFIVNGKPGALTDLADRHDRPCRRLAANGFRRHRRSRYSLLPGQLDIL